MYSLAVGLRFSIGQVVLHSQQSTDSSYTHAHFEQMWEFCDFDKNIFRVDRSTFDIVVEIVLVEIQMLRSTTTYYDRNKIKLKFVEIKSNIRIGQI